MEINKKYIGIGILTMFSILLIGSISAFGVGCAYHKDHPLEMSPGESKEIIFNLQNMAGGGDVTVKSSIDGDLRIIELIDTGEVFIPFMGEANIIAKVTIPVDAETGDVYPIKAIFTTVTESESGSFGFGSSVGRNFDIVIVPTAEELAKLEKQKERFDSLIPYLTAASIFLVIVMIIWLIKKKKRIN